MATLVLPGGSSSLDRYALRLARHLDVPVLRPHRSDGHGASPVSAIPEWERLDSDLLAAMRRAPGPLHLPHHHLGRYGRFLEAPFVITVHDMIRFLDMQGHAPPYIYRPSPREAAGIRLDLAGIREATRILVPSKHTLEDVHRLLGVPRERIAIVPHGVDRSRFRPRRDPPPLPGRFVLYVGSEHPRKNLRLLFEAYATLRRDPRFCDLRLVKAGRPGGSQRDYRAQTLALVRGFDLDGSVTVLGRIPGELLARLYSHAEALLFPSLYEGFGLPPLEAMACGCPVIASSATSVPEVVGEAAIVLDPTDPDAWVEATARLLGDPRLRGRLVDAGLARARGFSWEATARRTQEVYAGAAGPVAASR